MRRAPCLSLLLVLLAGGCAGGSDTPPRPDTWWQPQGDQRVTPGADQLVPPSRDTGTLPADGPAPPDPDSAPPPEADLGPEFNCGPADSECSDSDYMKSCTDGKCFARECCCPTARQCRAGSFPVCCDPGTVCQDTALGKCG